MSETRVDGFCLLNIDVPLPTANPALALLTVCLSTLGIWVDWTTQSLSNFKSFASHLLNLSDRAVANAVGRRPRPFGGAERTSVAPKTSSVCQPYKLLFMVLIGPEKCKRRSMDTR